MDKSSQHNLFSPSSQITPSQDGKTILATSERIIYRCDHDLIKFAPVEKEFVWQVSHQHTMSASKESGDRTRFKDVTNTSSKTAGLDPKELKRQRERERYARNKDEILRKQRERYHAKKDKSKRQKTQLENPDESVKVGKENIGPAEKSSDSLHINYDSVMSKVDNFAPTSKVLEDVSDTFINPSNTPTGHIPGMLPMVGNVTTVNMSDAPSGHITGDLMPMTMICEDAIESFFVNTTAPKETGSGDLTPTPLVLEDVQAVINTPGTSTEHLTGNNQENNFLHEQQQDSIRGSAMTVAKTTQTMTDAQKEKSRAKARAKYARLTDEQKLARRKRRNASEALRRSSLGDEEKEASNSKRRVANLTPKHRQSRVERLRIKKDLKRNILSGDSIAMKNPAWVPEPVFLPSKACASLTDKCSEFINHLEYKGTPVQISPAPKETIDKDVETFDMTASRRTKGRHVPVGERRALMARRNKQFRHNIQRTATDMSDEDTAEDIDSVQNDGESIQIESLPPPPIPNLGPDDDDDYEGIVHGDDSDDEGYLFAGQEEDSDHDVVMDDIDEELASSSSGVDPYDKVYSNIPNDTHMLKQAKNCKRCNAHRFQHETAGFCCREGKVKLANPDTPPELMRLWSSSDSISSHFQDNIRFFNGHFSFTSLYCNLDGDTTDVRGTGIYTFRAHGQMYHNIRSFGRDGVEPRHLELYFYDDDPSLEHRMRSVRKDHEEKDREVIRMLTDVLRANPYSEQLRCLGQAENLEDYRISLNLDPRLDQRTYNVPVTSEIAAVWVEGREHRCQFENSVLLHGKNREIHGIRSYHPSYDPLSYPLFFPRGEIGWHQKIPKTKPKTKRGEKDKKSNGQEDKGKRSYEEVAKEPEIAEEINDNDTDSAGNSYISVRDYYCYKFQIRPGIFNPIIYGKRLFQQFAVDTYIKIESSRLDYIFLHQDKLRADLYQGLVDSLAGGEGRTDAVGKCTVLPASFIGGPRDMRRRYMDAMALVRKFGKPDIFLIMTCNPRWDEIVRELLPGQVPQDHPDLVVRVFRAKLEALKKMLFEKDILGKVRAYVYVVEFQKRGLPHAHFLLIMQNKYKLTCPEQYDCLISAELPDRKKYPELRRLVSKHMMHGPCGALNRNCPCTKGRPSCKNHYPQPFNTTTIQGKDSYPVYRRRQDGRKEKVRGHELDNRWVVPYNPFLLRMFNCHINVEACGSIKAVKYLFKYLYKGHDRASVSVTEAAKLEKNGDINEINLFRDARWVTPPEALWRIYGFELSKNFPPVMPLQLHLPNMHMVSFKRGQKIENVVDNEDARKSMLTGVMKGHVGICTVIFVSIIPGIKMTTSGVAASIMPGA
ncbi:hypothetical protein ACP4OV_010552 [Aristida adscensionis]